MIRSSEVNKIKSQKTHKKALSYPRIFFHVIHRIQNILNAAEHNKLKMVQNEKPHLKYSILMKVNGIVYQTGVLNVVRGSKTVP